MLYFLTIADAASFFYFCHLKTSTNVHFCLFVNLSFIEFLFICCYNMKKKNEKQTPADLFQKDSNELRESKNGNTCNLVLEELR